MTDFTTEFIRHYESDKHIGLRGLNANEDSLTCYVVGAHVYAFGGTLNHIATITMHSMSTSH